MATFPCTLKPLGGPHMSPSRRGTQALIHCTHTAGSLSEPHNRSLLHLPLIRNMLGTFNEACNFFKYSPKRKKFLLAVIEKETPEASKTTLLSLCRTR